jgi:hypothetical protein
MTLLLVACALTTLQAPETSTGAPRGLRAKTESATPGYTLVAPLRSTSTFLVDLEGRVVHEWKSDAPPGQSVQLTDAGRLLRAERVENRVFVGGGQGGRIREFDWDGNVTWEFTLSDETRCMHHDIELLPNGNVLAIVWEKIGAEQAQAAGRDPATSADGLWADAVIEIEPVRPAGGKIVWEWHAFDHLVQARDAAKPNFAPIASRPDRLDVDSGARERPAGPEARRERERLQRIGYAGGDDGAPRDGANGPRGRGGPGGGGENDWTHVNGIDWRADLDVIVLSSRTLSELWVIDHGTTTEEARTAGGGRHGHGGDLLFRYGNPRVFGGAGEQKLWFQHDPRWLDNGHVLVFNNGGLGREASSVDEIDLGLTAESLKRGFDPARLADVKLVWSYTSPDIRSSHISGAQRLANGHTLIGAGEPGLVREVDAEGRVVWDYQSPLTGDAGPRQGPPPGGPRDGAGPGPGPGPRGMRGGRGGPGGPFGFFHVDRYASDHPALRALSPVTGSK